MKPVEAPILGILGGTLFASYLFAAWNFMQHRYWAFGPFAGAALPFVVILVLWWSGVV